MWEAPPRRRRVATKLPPQPQVIEIGIAVETYTAQSATPVKTRVVGIATETYSAFAAGKQKVRVTGLATETNTALALGKAKVKAVGVAAETNTALAATEVKRRTLGLPVETYTSFALSKAKVKSIGLTTETNTAQSLQENKSRVLDLPVETYTAYSVTSPGRLNTATETNTALPMTPVKKILLSGNKFRDKILSLSPAMYWDTEGWNGLNLADRSGNNHVCFTSAWGSLIEEPTLLVNGNGVALDLDPVRFSFLSAAIWNYNPFVNGTKRTFMGLYQRDSHADIHMLFGGSSGAGDVSAPYLYAGSPLYAQNPGDVVFAPSGNAAGGVAWLNVLPTTGEPFLWALEFEEDTDLVQLYINGEPKGQQPCAVPYGNTGTYNYSFFAGLWVANGGGAFTWDGAIDAMIIFHGVLSAADHLELYKLALDPDPKAIETSTAQPAQEVKSRVIGPAVETNTAQSFGKAKVKFLNTATETYTAYPFSTTTLIQLNTAVETNTAFSLQEVKRKTIGLATETNTAFSASRLKTKTIGIPSETNLAWSINVVTKRVVSIGIAYEFNTALPVRVRPRIITQIGIATETNTALPFKVPKKLGIGLAVETNTAYPVTYRMTGPPVGVPADQRRRYHLSGTNLRPRRSARR